MSTLNSLDDFCLTQIIKALNQDLAGVSRVNRRFYRLTAGRILRLFLQGEDGLALASAQDAAKYSRVYELWYNITCSPRSLPAATAAILFAAQHCPQVSELRLALRWAPTPRPTAAAAPMEANGEEEGSAQEQRLFARWWNRHTAYPCNLATQLAAAQQLKNVNRLYLRLGSGMSNALHCLALLPRLTALHLTVMQGLRCWLNLRELQPLKQLQLGWLQLEGMSLMESIPWSEDGSACPVPEDIAFWRLARVKGMLRWANALWWSPGQDVVHLEYCDEHFMDDHPTLLLPQLCNSIAWARVLVLARPPTQPPITWQGVPQPMSDAMTAAVLPSRSLRHLPGLQKLRMEHWWMAACSPRCWLALASAPKLASLVGLVALVPPPRRVILRRLKWLRGVVAWGTPNLTPLLQACPGLRGLEVVVELPSATLDPEMFPPDLFYQLHEYLNAEEQEEQQQEDEEQEQEGGLVHGEQVPAGLAGLFNMLQQEALQAPPGLAQMVQQVLQQVVPGLLLQQDQLPPPQEQQQQQGQGVADVVEGVADLQFAPQEQQQPAAAAAAAAVQGGQQGAMQPPQQPPVPVPPNQDPDDGNNEQGGGDADAGEDEGDQEGGAADQEDQDSELEQPVRWPQLRHPAWTTLGVRARCLRYLDLTCKVTGEHLAAAGTALQALPWQLPRVEVVDLVVPAGLVPALLLVVPRLTTVVELGLVLGYKEANSQAEPGSDTITTAEQLAAALRPLPRLRDLYLEGWQGLSPQQLAAQLVGVGPAQQSASAVRLRSVQYRRCGAAAQAPAAAPAPAPAPAPAAAAAAAAAAGQELEEYSMSTADVPPAGQQQQQQQQEVHVLPAWLQVSAAQKAPRPRVWRSQCTPLFEQPGVEEGWAGEAAPSDLEDDDDDNMW